MTGADGTRPHAVYVKPAVPEPSGAATRAAPSDGRGGLQRESRELLEFLPAALEVQETPASPAARLVMWTILAFVSMGLAWACIGQVDIVAVAAGKVVPTGRTKTVQPLENAVVAGIHVVEGQHVSEGDVLIALDPTGARADRARLGAERVVHALEAARLAALLETGTEDPFIALRHRADPADIARQEALLEEQRVEQAAAIEAIDREMEEKRAALQAIDARIAALDATLPLITEEAASLESLMRKGLAPRVQWLAIERQRIAQARELDVQQGEREAMAAVLATLAERRRVTASQYKGRWLKELAQANAAITFCEEELAKAERRLALTQLVAPVSGTVQQLAVHTVGGVVTEAQPLLVIVPDNAAMEVQAMVPNREIGFVRAGQRAVIKLETFPYTRYGHIEGTLSKVSGDAVSDERHGLVYAAHVELDRSYMLVEGRRVPLSAGMAASVEIHTGMRRIIDFLLSPLMRYRDESGRER